MYKALQDKNFYVLLIASIIGALAVLPYASALIGLSLTIKIVVFTTIQSFIIYAILILIGLNAAKKLDLNIIASQKYTLISLMSGLCVGFALKFLDHFIFQNQVHALQANTSPINIWFRILASLYGGINEEILLRLFAVSLTALFLNKITKLNKQQISIISIIFCALLFAAGHLPMLYKILHTPTIIDIIRVMLLNSFPGIVFGGLYWRYGLTSAMLSHFCADLVVHVL